MPKWSRDYALTLVLGAVVAVLLLAVAVEWAVLAGQKGQVNQAPPSKTAPTPEPEIAAEDFGLPGLEGYEQIAGRPLFMENRRPGVEITETAAPPPPPMPMTLKLMGIVSIPNEKTTLICNTGDSGHQGSVELKGDYTVLMADAKGKYKRLKYQDTLDGWQLVEICPDKVTLQQGDKREDLSLLKKRPKTAAAPNPALAAGQPRPGQPPQPGQPPMPGQTLPPAVPQPPDLGSEDGTTGFPEDAPEVDIPEEDTGNESRDE